MQAQINVLSELERYGVRFEFGGNGEIKVRCPFHDDKSPSASISAEKRLFKCHSASCGKSADFLGYLAVVLKTTRATVLVDLSKRYDLEQVRTVGLDTIERYHADIWEADTLLKELANRGVTPALIIQYKLGRLESRVTIPVLNRNNLCVNLRKYSPGVRGPDKMRNTRGMGKPPRLYPIEQLSYKRIMLCGGEMKAIVAADELNRKEVGAITATAGEGAWHQDLTPEFANKDVYVCLDIDAAGKIAAEKLAVYVARVAASVFIVDLPLDIDQYPKGDINDFIGLEGGKLFPLLETARKWRPPLAPERELGEPIDGVIGKAINAANVNTRYRLKTTITVGCSQAAGVPSKVHVTCDKAQPECITCPVITDAADTFDVSIENEYALSIIDRPRKNEREPLMEMVGIPLSCKSCVFKTLLLHNVLDVMAEPAFNCNGFNSERKMHPVLCAAKNLELNSTYWLTGRVVRSPEDSRIVFLASNAEPTTDSLDEFTLANAASLTAFQPDDWTLAGLSHKLGEIYRDLEHNVTRIYRRRPLHIAIDLAYYSCLYIDWQGKPRKGWTEVLILGDSAQGKTEAVNMLREHYRAGDKVSCTNATTAGLIGGMDKIGNKWFAKLGKWPLNDRRLLILEELKGAGVEVIAKLTDTRDSGVADISKIESIHTMARARLVAISNPRSDRRLSTYTFAVEAIKELIGAPEDVRRFDFATILQDGDVKIADMHAPQRKVEHVFTSDKCNRLLMWVWTRPPATFKRDAADLIVSESIRLSKKYTDAIPLIDRGSTPHKLARMSAALAGRTFSHEGDYETIVVRKCHVEYLVRFLDEVYSARNFSYDTFTLKNSAKSAIKNEAAVTKALRSLSNAHDVCEQLLYNDKIASEDLALWIGLDRQLAMRLMSLLVTNNALIKRARNFVKSSAFIDLLRHLLEDRTGLSNVPNFLEQEF